MSPVASGVDAALTASGGRKLVSCNRSCCCTENTEAPGSRGATTAQVGDLYGRSDPKAQPREACVARPRARHARNEVSRAAAAFECQPISVAGH
jgi:hypothetical protein